jgi:hypothetical protein
MARLGIFAGFYADPAFLDAMNFNYTTGQMPESVKKLKEHGQLQLATMKWGDYQPILTPSHKWPGKTYQLWQESMQAARDSLAKQTNKLPLSPGDAAVPATKCDLADAAVRKCFNSEPPIQIIIDVLVKQASDPDPDLHDVKIEWATINKEATLKFTMICPYEPPMPKGG